MKLENLKIIQNINKNYCSNTNKNDKKIKLLK